MNVRERLGWSGINVRTVYFLEPRLLRDGRRRVLVQPPEVPREVKLLVDIDTLVAENCLRL